MTAVADIARPTPGTAAGIAFLCRPGRGLAYPVVLLHGIGSHARSYEPLMAALPPAADVIAWNAPGYASSQFGSVNSCFCKTARPAWTRERSSCRFFLYLPASAPASCEDLGRMSFAIDVHRQGDIPQLGEHLGALLLVIAQAFPLVHDQDPGALAGDGRVVGEVALEDGVALAVFHALGADFRAGGHGAAQREQCGQWSLHRGTDKPGAMKMRIVGRKT